MKTFDDAEELYKQLTELVGEEHHGQRFQKFLADVPNEIEHIVTERSEVWTYYFHELGSVSWCSRKKYFQSTCSSTKRQTREEKCLKIIDRGRLRHALFDGTDTGTDFRSKASF